MLTSVPSNPIAVGYGRGSTEEQQNTLLAQREQITAYCTFKGITLAETFIDEGESAVATDFLERPVVGTMLARMKELGATSIIITKLDRGFRGAVDLLTTIDLLKQRGIGLHALDIGLDPGNPVGEMVATIMAAIARFECRRRSERQKDAFAAMRAGNQRTGAIPYGWDAVAAARTSRTGRAADNLEPNPFEQIILARLLAGDLAAVSANEAARQLNRAGITAKNGGKWHGATVLSIRRTGRLAA